MAVISATVPCMKRSGKASTLTTALCPDLTCPILVSLMRALTRIEFGVGKLEDRLAFADCDALINPLLHHSPAIRLIEVDDEFRHRGAKCAPIDIPLQAIAPLGLELKRGFLILLVRLDRLDLGFEGLDILGAGVLHEPL